MAAVVMESLRVVKMSLQLPADNFLRKILTLLIGSGSAQLLALLISPLITRLYSPEDFGMLGVFVAILTMALVVATMGYDLAVPIADDDSSAMNVLVICVFFVVVFTALSIAAVAICGGVIVDYLHVPTMRPYLWLLPISLFGAGLVKSLTMWAIRKGDYKEISKSKVVQSLGQSASQLALGFLQMGGFGLLVSDVIGRSSGGGFFLKQMISRDKEAVCQLSLARSIGLLRRYKRFAYISVPSTVFHTAGTVLPTILLASQYGASVAGWYAFCQKIVWGPMSLVGQSIAQVFLGEAASAVKKDPHYLKVMMESIVKKLLIFSGIPMLLVMLMGGAVFPVIFGSAWKMSGIYAQIMAISFVAQFVVGPVFQVLNILERQSWLLACDVIGVVLISLSIYVSRFLGYSGVIAVALISVSTVIMYLSLLVAAFASINSQISLCPVEEEAKVI